MDVGEQALGGVLKMKLKRVPQLSHPSQEPCRWQCQGTEAKQGCLDNLESQRASGMRSEKILLR